MVFPEESVAEAREIAHKYSIRGRSDLEKALRLYHGQFLEIGYGFNDALRRGRCGHFLHQAERDADCFSFLGIQYLVARECGLNPRMWWATDMRDVREGDDYNEQKVGDHSFMTVEINGKTYIHDRFYAAFGEAVFEPGRIIYFRKDEHFGKVRTVRHYTTLTELSEEEYVARMLQHQTPEYGREVLSAGQIVMSHGKRISLEFHPDSGILTAAMNLELEEEIAEKTPTRNIHFVLEAMVDEDGRWLIGEGSVESFFSQHSGWLLSQAGNRHMIQRLPYNVVNEYIQHLQAAAAFFGRRTGISKLRTKDHVAYFEDRGFSATGEILFENGVDPSCHSSLLEEVLNGWVSMGNEPEAAMPSIHQEAAYLFQALQARSHVNRRGLLYSQEQRNAFIADLCGQLHEHYQNAAELMFKAELAGAGLIPGLRRIQRALYAIQANLGNSPHERFYGWMTDRKKSVAVFDQAIDFALFQIERPIGTIVAGKEELSVFYMMIAHERMIQLSRKLPVLELRQFQPGIRRLLAAS